MYTPWRDSVYAATPLDIVMEARASLGLSFIGMYKISFLIMWPLHNQSYCNISMKNGSNVIIPEYPLQGTTPLNTAEPRV